MSSPTLTQPKGRLTQILASINIRFVFGKMADLQMSSRFNVTMETRSTVWYANVMCMWNKMCGECNLLAQMAAACERAPGGERVELFSNFFTNVLVKTWRFVCALQRGAEDA